jgi:hypothetical protein
VSRHAALLTADIRREALVSYRVLRVRTYKLNENSDDDFEPTTDLNQPVGGLAVLIANCAAKARL